MTIKRAVAGVFALIVIGVAVFLFSNRVLIERHYTQGETNTPNGYTWYDPTEVIAGNHKEFFDAVPESQRTITESALVQARDYAARNRSESLLVWHRGALQLSEYWMDLTPSDVVNSRSMHKMVGGLLIARATADGHIDSIDDYRMLAPLVAFYTAPV